MLLVDCYNVSFMKNQSSTCVSLLMNMYSIHRWDGRDISPIVCTLGSHLYVALSQVVISCKLSMSLKPLFHSSQKLTLSQARSECFQILWFDENSRRSLQVRVCIRTFLILPPRSNNNWRVDEIDNTHGKNSRRNFWKTLWWESMTIGGLMRATVGT